MAVPLVSYELASVEYCVASHYSLLGQRELRSDNESIKRAIASFQQAAGILLDMANTRRRGSNDVDAGPEYRPEALAMLGKLMLAQAQECAWQKAVLDSLRNGIIAKLANSTAALYEASANAGAKSRDVALAFAVRGELSAIAYSSSG